MFSWKGQAKQNKIPIKKFRPVNGESINDVFCRIKVAFEHLKQFGKLFRKENVESKEVKILIVTHGGWISNFYRICMEFHGGSNSWETAKNCHFHLFTLDNHHKLVNISSNVLSDKLEL
jgi:broad specificity phosphatase PhoE